jgi:uncharacterized membrane protein
LYPLIPWIAVMALGFCLGKLYDPHYPGQERKQLLIKIGLISLVVFFVLRSVNIYGDPQQWTYHASSITTVMDFFNVTKYPPSLLFLCLTLGAVILTLGLLEGKKPVFGEAIIVFGKVPLFYYVIHIFAIHLLALLAAVSMGHSWQTMIFIGSSSQPSPLLKGKFGFTLIQVYLLWISIIFLIYPLCKYWNNLKITNRHKWWVSYV